MTVKPGVSNFDQPHYVQVAELMWMLPSSMSPRDVIGWLRGTGSSV